MCRQKAAEAKQSAAKAKNPLIKRAFEEVKHPLMRSRCLWLGLE
jgi:hypothetical protein